MRLIRTLFITTLSGFVISIASPSTAEIQTFGKPVKIFRYSNEPLSAAAENTFDWFRKDKQYFGAFYYNTTENTGAAVVAYHSLRSALWSAKASCQDRSRNHPELCKLYATSVPGSFSAKTTKASGLGRHAYLDFIDRYQGLQRNGLWGAFAISGMSEYGYSSGHGTKRGAAQAAIVQCNLDVAETFATEYSAKENRDRHRRGLDKCVVVDVAHP